MMPALFACSINKTAMRMVSNVLSSSSAGTAFASDDDPELVGDALPFALKLYEILIDEIRDNPNIYLAAGSGYIMYANAYVQSPADMLPDAAFDKKEIMTLRAQKLYLRGRDYVLQGLEVKYPGFTGSLDNAAMTEFLGRIRKEDVAYLYWAAAGWLAAYATNPFDVSLGVGMKKATAMMEAALRIDEAYGDGVVHELLVQYYGSLPQSMGGSEKRARYHFNKAVELSKGEKASPYVALAATVSVKNQNIQEFTELLNKALAIDSTRKTGNRLANIISQRKARWLLEHRRDRFLLDPNEGEKK